MRMRPPPPAAVLLFSVFDQAELTQLCRRLSAIDTLPTRKQIQQRRLRLQHLIKFSMNIEVRMPFRPEKWYPPMLVPVVAYSEMAVCR